MGHGPSRAVPMAACLPAITLAQPLWLVEAVGDGVSVWTVNPAWHEHPWKDLMSTKKRILPVSSGIVAFNANYCVF